MKKILVILIILEVVVAIGIVAGGIWMIKNWNKKEAPVINVTGKENLIIVDYPKPNQTIKSPLVITGKARGNWFFEASFPVTLTNWDGLIIAQGIAQAKGEWMTENFVPFSATLNFTMDENSPSNKGFLILKKDNPSGLPEYDDHLEIQVILGN